MAVLLLLTTCAFGAYMFWRARREVDQFTDRIINSTVSLIDQRINALLRETESQAQLISALARPTLAEAASRQPTDSRGFDALQSEVIEMMRINQDLSSITVTLDRAGEYLLAYRKADNTIRIQTSIAVQDGPRLTREWELFGEQLQRIDQKVGAGIDGRKRATYEQCKEVGLTVWGSDDRALWPEIASASTVCSTPIFNQRGQFVGVVSISLTITDLNRFLQTIKVGEGGFAFLMRLDQEGTAARLLAHPDPTLLKQPSFAVGDPLTMRIMDRAGEMTGLLSANAARRADAEIDGQRYVVGLRPIIGERSPPWVAAVVVPSGEWLEGFRTTAVVMIIVGALAIIVAIGGAFVLAEQVTRPLRLLMKETLNIRELDLGGRELPDSGIVEIDELASSVQQMKTSLRSFEKLVPSDYARWLMRTGREAKLGGEKRELTTSFADISGFTQLAERVAPEQIVEILAEYLDVLSAEALRTEGTVDKFNGDDVMAFWGAPNPLEDHAVRACQAAINSRDALRGAMPDWRERGIPELAVHFGIATGEVVVGNIGSRNRMNYTVIGDSVNLASRLQGLNKTYGTLTLISERTKELAGDNIQTRRVDWVTVAGRERPEPAYELLGMKGERGPEILEAAKAYEDALDRYREQDWVVAEDLFRQVLKVDPTDVASLLMIKRIERYLSHPPAADWDGVTRFQIK